MAKGARALRKTRWREKQRAEFYAGVSTCDNPKTSVIPVVIHVTAWLHGRGQLTGLPDLPGLPDFEARAAQRWCCVVHDPAGKDAAIFDFHATKAEAEAAIPAGAITTIVDIAARPVERRRELSDEAILAARHGISGRRSGAHP